MPTHVNGMEDIVLCSYMLLPRFMECRRGLAMRIVSVRLSVKRVNGDKTEKISPYFLHHTKEQLA